LATTRVFWILVLVAVAIGGWRVLTGQADLRRLGQDHEYAFELEVPIRDAVGPFHLEICVPRDGGGLRLQDEQVSAGDLAIRMGESEGGRRLHVEGDRGDLPARVRYAARIGTRPVRFDLDPDLRWHDLAAPAALDSTGLIQARHPEVVRRLRTVLADALPDTAATPGTPAAWQRRLRAAGVGPVDVVDRLYTHTLDDLRSADFSGQTDAVTALRLGEASCGGKSRLLVAMLRTVGLEARVIGGLILGDAGRSRTSHVWVEARLGDQWVPLDPLNGHRAELPASYLTLYRGDLPLIVHARGLAFDYGFRAPLDRVPAAWALQGDAAAVMNELPILRRDQFSVILLAPFALLLVVFLRQVVGVASIGVFLPVLLGFCVTQVGWAISGVLLVLTLLLGVAVRLLLGRLNLLHVPRAALLITFLVLLFLVATVSLDRLGVHASRGLLVLPLAALAMAVERVTVVALDQGVRASAWLLAQTLLLAVISALVLMQPLFKVLTVTFPEILLIVLAEIIVIGQYRGLRLTERLRFRSVLAEEAP
jgi:transglutaminase-like putative cysteine protease